MAAPRIVLTDLEGTTSSISFVKDTLFPYARRALPGFLARRGAEPEVRGWLDVVARELGGAPADEQLVATLQQWIDEDRKHTALKALQGMIWADGFHSGAFTAHFYVDAVQALRSWRAAGVPLYVYSSGSVAAQKLFFGFSDFGDLTELISGWFDTEVGAKRERQSYEVIASRIASRIAARVGPASDLLFLSDVVAELDAARAAGLQTALLDRRQDYPTARTGEAAGGHLRVTSFEELPPLR